MPRRTLATAAATLALTLVSSLSLAYAVIEDCETVDVVSAG